MLRLLPLAALAFAVLALPAPASAMECIGVEGECIWPPVVCVTEPCGPDWNGIVDRLLDRVLDPLIPCPVGQDQPCGPPYPAVPAHQQVPCVIGSDGDCLIPVYCVTEPCP